MPRIRLFAMLPLAAVILGCTEPLAPRASTGTDALTMAPANLTHGGVIGADVGAPPLDVHAVRVKIQGTVFNNVVIDEYSFHVHGWPGDMKGKFDLMQTRIFGGVAFAVIIASGEMECGGVVGNKAHTGGRITYTTFPAGLPIGSQLTWTVTDNGHGNNAPDTASQPLGNNSQAHCAGMSYQYPERPLENGQVHVRG